MAEDEAAAEASSVPLAGPSKAPAAKLFSIFAPRPAKSAAPSEASNASNGSSAGAAGLPVASLSGIITQEASSRPVSTSLPLPAESDELLVAPALQRSNRANGKLKQKPSALSMASTSSAAVQTSQTPTVLSSDDEMDALVGTQDSIELSTDDGDSDLSDDFTIISSRSPPRKDKQKTRGKRRARKFEGSSKTNGSTPQKKRKTNKAHVIVIDDSPVRDRSSFGGFASMSSTFQQRKQKRKEREPQLPRWPTAEEHSTRTVSDPPAYVSASRWPRSLKGKEKETFESTVWSDLSPKDSCFSRFDFPVPAQIALDELEDLLPPRSLLNQHALLDRLAKSAKANHSGPKPLKPRGEPPYELWTTLYGPRNADEILGASNQTSARIFRDWLKEVGIRANAADQAGKKGKRPRTIERRAEKPKKKVRTLDGWIVDSDDDIEDESQELADDDGLDLLGNQPSSSRASLPNLTNVILLVGPNGSGKSATVQAVAHELGWDVFEVNAGMGKRSPAHIEKLVGDVGRNHIVRGGGSPSKTKTPFSFAADAAKQKANGVPAADAPVDSAPKGSKQSLILIEEVDVLFKDETTGGWYGGLVSFVENSRRPIVLTCNYDNDVDYEKLPFQTISWAAGKEQTQNLPFEPIDAEVAAAYLRTVALNEGHIISTDHAKALYSATAESDRGLPSWYLASQTGDTLPEHAYKTQSRHPDLRQALLQLQFDCQWGLGESKWPRGEKGSKAGAWFAKWPEVNATATATHELRAHGVGEAVDVESFIDACCDSKAFRLETYEGGPDWQKKDDEVVFTALPNPSFPRAPQPVETYDAVKDLQRTIRELAHLGPVDAATSELHDRQSAHNAIAAPFAYEEFFIGYMTTHSNIATSYMPTLRAVTEAERVRLAAGEDEDEIGMRRLRKSTRASAFVPVLKWREGEAETVLSTGFADMPVDLDLGEQQRQMQEQEQGEKKAN